MGLVESTPRRKKIQGKSKAKLASCHLGSWYRIPRVGRWADDPTAVLTHVAMREWMQTLTLMEHDPPPPGLWEQ